MCVCFFLFFYFFVKIRIFLRFIYFTKTCRLNQDIRRGAFPRKMNAAIFVYVMQTCFLRRYNQCLPLQTAHDLECLRIRKKNAM